MLKVRYRRTKAYTMVTCLLLLGILGMVAVGQSLCYYARIMSYTVMEYYEIQKPVECRHHAISRAFDLS